MNVKTKDCSWEEGDFAVAMMVVENSGFTEY